MEVSKPNSFMAGFEFVADEPRMSSGLFHDGPDLIWLDAETGPRPPEDGWPLAGTPIAGRRGLGLRARRGKAG